MKIWTRALAAGAFGLLLALPRPAAAISMQLLPASTAVSVGDSFSIDVAISGLGPLGTAPSVGAFEVAVGFDSTRIAFEGATFGALLGDATLGEAITDVSAMSGLTDIAEVSLLSPPALDALQPDGFVLATLTFQSLASAASSLDFAKVTLSDGFGRALAVTSLSGAVVGPVPEPAGFLALAIGLLVVRKRLAAFG
jgi:hypothetical protein